MGPLAWLPYGAVSGEGAREGTMPLAWLPAGFQSVPLLPTSQLGSYAADSQIGGFVYLLGPSGYLQ